MLALSCSSSGVGMIQDPLSHGLIDDDDVSAVERRSAADFWRILPSSQGIRQAMNAMRLLQGPRCVSFGNRRMCELPTTWGKADFRKVCGEMLFD